METKNAVYLRIIPIIGLILILFGYYYITLQIVDSKKELSKSKAELKEVELKKEQARQLMLLYQSKTKTLNNVIAQSNDQQAIEKAVAIVSDTTMSSIASATYKPNVNKVSVSAVKKNNKTYQPETVKSDYKVALAWEEKGYNALLLRNVDEAITAFSNSENNYNGFHMSYEITRYLRANKEKLKDPTAEFWTETYVKIAKDFSWKMPKNMKSKLIEASKSSF